MKMYLIFLYGILSVWCNGQDQILTESAPFIHAFKTADAEEFKSFVKDLASDKTVIGLGEVSHFTKECYELKHQIILELMDQGFNGLVLEVDYGQALLWNDYVINGNGNLDTLIASSGWFTYRTEEFKNLIADIREYNVSNEEYFQIYGMEMTAVNHNIDWVTKYLQSTKLAPGELMRALAKERKTIAFQNYSEEEIKDYWDLYFMLRKFLAENESLLKETSSPKEFSIAERITEVFRQFASYISQNEFYLKVELRDMFSMRNVMWSLGRQEENRRLVIWAHNGHVAKTSVLFNYDVLGHYLEQRLGESYFAIGFTFNEGSFGAFGESGFQEWKMKRETNISFTTGLAAFESPYLVFDIRKNLTKDNDLQSLLRSSIPIRRDISESYNPKQENLMNINLSITYDALIYIDKTNLPTRINWLR